MKPAITLLIAAVAFTFLNANSFPADELPNGATGNKSNSEFMGGDLIVRFDSTFSNFAFYDVKDDFEDLGLVLFSYIDSSNNVAAFRPISFYSDSDLIRQVYQIPHVDTIYYPLLEEEESIIYYDDRRLTVYFYEEIADTTCEQIIAEHNCSTIYHSSYGSYYYIKIPANQQVFSMVDIFLTHSEVQYAFLYIVGFGGYYTTDYIRNYYWDDCQFTYENGKISFVMEWLTPNSTCFQTGEVQRGDDHVIDYYGAFYQGDLTEICTITDTLSFSVADTANFLLTLHQLTHGEYEDYRTIIRRETATALDIPSNTGLLQHSVTEGLLYVWCTGQIKQIRTIGIYSINGMIRKQNAVADEGREKQEIPVSGLPRGIYMARVVFSDGTTGSFKFLK